ncbi:MAG: hypothetical protein CL433_09865, partial [Acidimicrobiaceae bacterium]|nr:hypothetical protein [Acidimicrobiaceae bacterium]
MNPKAPKNLAVYLGWVSLLQDLGSKMVVPIVPLYLTLALGASPLVVGVVDGLAAATVVFVAPFAGRLSTPARSPALVRLGYGISSVTKIALVVASSWLTVLAVRMVDRAGKGVRDAPRDLILAASRPDRTASAFGVQQAMDKLGGAIGPLVGILVYESFDESFDAVFVLAFVPCALSVGLLFRRLSTDGSGAPARFQGVVGLVQRRRLTLLGFGAAGTVPVALLIVRAVEQGAGVATVLGAFALLRMVTAVVAVPGGHLAGRFGARWAVVLGHLVLLAGLGLAQVSSSPASLWVVLALIGASDALLRGPIKAWLISEASTGSRAVVFGMWSGVRAAGGLVAGVLAG